MSQGMQKRRVGFLGAGNMAEALVRGMLDAGFARREDLLLSDPSEARRRHFEVDLGVRAVADNSEVAEWSEVLVLAVKPQVLEACLDEVAGALAPSTLVVSIAAGVPMAEIAARLAPGMRLVRAMPNGPALVLAGATGVSPGIGTTTADVAFARGLFDAVGTSILVEEALLDAVTGLSGSGPAYVMLFVEALAAGGVRAGLGADDAFVLALRTVAGAAAWLLESGEAPAALRSKVTSPGGTTLAGLAALEAGAFRETVETAVQAAATRSRELGAGFGGSRGS